MQKGSGNCLLVDGEAKHVAKGIQERQGDFNKVERTCILNYPELKEYCRNLNVGEAFKSHDETDSCNYMGYCCTVTYTLTMIFKTIQFYGQLSFLYNNKQKHFQIHCIQTRKPLVQRSPKSTTLKFDLTIG